MKSTVACHRSFDSQCTYTYVWRAITTRTTNCWDHDTNNQGMLITIRKHVFKSYAMRFFESVWNETNVPFSPHLVLSRHECKPGIKYSCMRIHRHEKQSRWHKVCNFLMLCNDAWQWLIITWLFFFADTQRDRQNALKEYFNDNTNGLDNETNGLGKETNCSDTRDAENR